MIQPNNHDIVVRIEQWKNGEFPNTSLIESLNWTKEEYVTWVTAGKIPEKSLPELNSPNKD